MNGKLKDHPLVKASMTAVEAEIDRNIKIRKKSGKEAEKYRKYFLTKRENAIEKHYETFKIIAELTAVRGMSYKEAAKEMGTTEGALAMLRSRWPWLEALAIEELRNDILAQRNSSVTRAQTILSQSAPKAVRLLEELMSDDLIDTKLRVKIAESLITHSGASLKNKSVDTLNEVVLSKAELDSLQKAASDMDEAEELEV